MSYPDFSFAIVLNCHFAVDDNTDDDNDCYNNYVLYANLELYYICRIYSISLDNDASDTSPLSVHCGNNVKCLYNVAKLQGNIKN